MSHSILRQIASLAVAAATLAACKPDSPVAPFSRSTARVPSMSPTTFQRQMYREEATVPFSFVVYASCVNGGQGEVLQVNGDLQYKGHWITTNDGQRTHHALIEQFTGSAIGWDTGETYDVATREHSQGNIDYGTDGVLDSGEDFQRLQLSLTSRATGLLINIVLTGRFVETPNGDFVMDGWDARERCK
ncbi:MAG TPA: hypothetical protein VJN70_00595 [Gemmatimonadaceae bacterium]|nr:hypothetical protein [Gemmatimonadaceae bacterium]